MPAFSLPPSSTAPAAPLPSGRNLAGVGIRSTTSVRRRYRRQTAVLMMGTTVVGLWMGLAAPSVSPVTPLAPPAALEAAGPVTGSTPETTVPRRGDRQPAGDGSRGRDGFGGHRA